MTNEYRDGWRALAALALVSLAGCGGDGPTTQAKSLDDYDQRFKARVSGDDVATLDCHGTDEIGIGYLPGPPGGQGGVFNVSCQMQVEGRALGVTIGSAAPTFASHEELKGTGGFSDGVHGYDSVTNTTYYDDSPDGSESVAHLQLSKVVQLKARNRFLQRYHLIGTFDFVAAYAPERPSAACQQEAAAAAATGRRRPPMPPFNPAVCGARQVQVTGSFDIVQDFMKTPA